MLLQEKNAQKLTRFHQLTAIIWKCLQKLIKFLALSQKTNRVEEEQDISPVSFWTNINVIFQNDKTHIHTLWLCVF